MGSNNRIIQKMAIFTKFYKIEGLLITNLKLCPLKIRFMRLCPLKIRFMRFVKSKNLNRK
jgi:hypothetical protein